MKLLSEWTTEEIIEELKFGHGIPEACDGTEPLLAELLRREREHVLREVVEPKLIGAAIRELLRLARADERERCAAECDAVVSDMTAAGENRPALSAGICAARIRELS